MKSLFLMLVIGCFAAVAQEIQEAEKAADTVREPFTTAVADEDAETVITSERLTYDYDEKFALFETNVVVTDPRMTLTADKLHVRFKESGEVVWIQATGNVIITQENRKAYAGKVTHTVESGEFLLEDDPKVIREKDMVSAEKIRFWHNEKRVVCEPRAKLKVFLSEEDRDSVNFK